MMDFRQTFHSPVATTVNYSFLSPSRILFGWGRRAELCHQIPPGSKVMILSGSRTLERQGVLGELAANLEKSGISPQLISVPGKEPEVADVDRLVEQIRREMSPTANWLVGLGGGSTLDLTKAVAGLVTNHAGNSVLDYLEGVGKGLTLKQPPLPWIAIPTTAGTGSEATKNAVISSYAPPFKKSFRDDRLLASCVIVDPELTVSLPPATTAATGMDALTQLIESFVSKKSAPIPRALAMQGIPQVIAHLRTAVREGSHRPAREAMAHAALLSGLALANSGLGLAHGVAAGLGALFHIPHGLACAVMLPIAMRVNRECRMEDLAIIGQLLTGQEFDAPQAAVDAGIEVVLQLCADLKIPRSLRELGVTADRIPDLVAASQGNSLQGNPREISSDLLNEILESIL